MSKEADMEVHDVDKLVDALASLPLDVVEKFAGNTKGPFEGKDVVKALSEMSRSERVSNRIISSQSVFELRMFFTAQKAFNLLEKGMDPDLKKSDRPPKEALAEARNMVDIYMKRFPKVVVAKPQVTINKRVHDIPTTEKAWFVKSGKLMHAQTWAAAEKEIRDKTVVEGGCAMNNGGPCMALKDMEDAPEDAA